MWETWVWSLGWEDPLEKEQLPTPVFWPGEFHGQRSLAGYSPWGCSRTWLSGFHFHANLVLVALLLMCSQGLFIPRFINTNNVHRDISRMGPLWRDILVPMLHLLSEHFITGLPLWLSWWRIHLQCGSPGFNPWVEDPLRREMLPTPVFWPGEFHGLYSPWGGKESDMTEGLSLHD